MTLSDDEINRIAVAVSAAVVEALTTRSTYDEEFQYPTVAEQNAAIEEFRRPKPIDEAVHRCLTGHSDHPLRFLEIAEALDADPLEVADSLHRLIYLGRAVDQYPSPGYLPSPVK
jgi:hypothetical protein